MKDRERCIEEILSYGLGKEEVADLIVIDVLRKFGGVPDEIMGDQAIELVLEMKANGLIVIGTWEEKGFSPLRESHDKLGPILKQRWEAITSPHVFGEAFWLVLTEAGEERAEKWRRKGGWDVQAR